MQVRNPQLRHEAQFDLPLHGAPGLHGPFVRLQGAVEQQRIHRSDLQILERHLDALRDLVRQRRRRVVRHVGALVQRGRELRLEPDRLAADAVLGRERPQRLPY